MFDALRFHNGLAGLRAAHAAGYPTATYSGFRVRVPNPVSLAERNHLAHVHGVHADFQLAPPRIPNRSKTAASVAYDLAHAALMRLADEKNLLNKDYSALVANPVAKAAGLTAQMLQSLWQKQVKEAIDQAATELSGLPRFQQEARALLAAEKEARSLVSSMKVPTGDDARMKANVRAIHLVELAAKEGRALTPTERVEVMSYTGFGGLGKYFSLVDNQWQLRRIYESDYPIPAEYRPGKAAADYEYFTPTLLCEAIAERIQPLLAAAENPLGKIIALEPSAGVGRLVEPLSEHDVKWTLVEYNRAQSRLLEALYPSARIHGPTKFESFASSYGNELEGQYNLIVANPPYGQWTDSAIDRAFRGPTTRAEGYFLLRCLPWLARNGVAVFIVPYNILSSDDNHGLRKEMLQQWHLAGAARLPAGVFDNVAMVIDVLFCVGRGGKLNVPAEDQYIVDGTYFDQHPDHVLGEYSATGGRFGGAAVKRKAGVDPYVELRKIQLRPMGAQTSYNAAQAQAVETPGRKAATPVPAAARPRPVPLGQQGALTKTKALETSYLGSRDRLVVTPLQRHVARACLLAEYLPTLEKLASGNAEQWEQGRTAHAELRYCLQAVCRFVQANPEALAELETLRKENVEGARLFLSKIYPVGDLFAYPARQESQLRDANTLALTRFPKGGTIAAIAANLGVPPVDMTQALLANGWRMVLPATGLASDNNIDLLPEAEFAVGDVGARYQRCSRFAQMSWLREHVASLPNIVTMESLKDLNPAGWVVWKTLTSGMLQTYPYETEENLALFAQDSSLFNGHKERVTKLLANLEHYDALYPNALQSSLDAVSMLCGFDDVAPFAPYLETSSYYLTPRSLGLVVEAAAKELQITSWMKENLLVVPVVRYTGAAGGVAVTPRFADRRAAYQFYKTHLLPSPMRSKARARLGAPGAFTKAQQEIATQLGEITEAEFISAKEKEGITFDFGEADCFGQPIKQVGLFLNLNYAKEPPFMCGSDWYIGPEGAKGAEFTLLATLAENNRLLRTLVRTADNDAAYKEAIGVALAECPSMPAEARNYLYDKLPRIMARAEQVEQQYNQLVETGGDEDAWASMESYLAGVVAELPTVVGEDNILTTTGAFAENIQVVRALASVDGIWLAVSPLGNGVIGWPATELSSFIEASLTGYEFGIIRYNPTAVTSSQTEKAFRDALAALVESSATVQADVRHQMRAYGTSYVRRETSSLMTGLTRWKGNISLLPHQAKGAWQTFYDEGALMAFDVGVGKTFCGTATIVQHRQYADCRRPVMVLPNPLTSKWCRDFGNCTPDYAVAVIGDTFRLAVSDLTGQIEVRSTDDTDEERTQKVLDFNEGLYDVMLLRRSIVGALNPSLAGIAAFAARLQKESLGDSIQVVYQMDKSGMATATREDRGWEKGPDDKGWVWDVDAKVDDYTGFYGYDDGKTLRCTVPSGKSYVITPIRYKTKGGQTGLFVINADHLHYQTHFEANYVGAINGLRAFIEADLRGEARDQVQNAVTKGNFGSFEKLLQNWPKDALRMVNLARPEGDADAKAAETDASLYETWTCAIYFLLGVKNLLRARELARLASGFAPIIENGQILYSAYDEKLFADAVRTQWDESKGIEASAPTRAPRATDDEEGTEEEDGAEGDETTSVSTKMPWRRINIGFEQLKPDLMVIDEAQMFKNLWFPLKFATQRVRFLGSAQTSAMSATLDAWLTRTRQTQKCKVQLLSATPAKNSPIELYTMLAYISPEWLRERAIANVHVFATRFLKLGTTLYVKPNGNIETNAKAVVSFNDMPALKAVLFRFATFLDADQAAEDLPIADVAGRAKFAKPRPVIVKTDIALAPAERTEIAALRAAADEIGNAKKSVAYKGDEPTPTPYLPELTERDGSNTMLILSQLPRVGALPALSMVVRPVFRGELYFRADTLTWMLRRVERVNQAVTLDELYSTDGVLVPTSAQKRKIITRSIATLQALKEAGEEIPRNRYNSNAYDEDALVEILREGKAYETVSCGFKVLPPRWWWNAVSDDEREYLLRNLSRWQVRAVGVGRGKDNPQLSADERDSRERMKIKYDLRHSMVDKLPYAEGLLALEEGREGPRLTPPKFGTGIVDFEVPINVRNDAKVRLLIERAKRARTTIASWYDRQREDSARAKHASEVRKSGNKAKPSRVASLTEDEYKREVLSLQYFPALPDSNKNVLTKAFAVAFDPTTGVDFWKRMGYAETTRIKALVKQVMSYDRGKAQIIFCLEKDMQLALYWALVRAGFPGKRIGIMNADTTPDASKKLEFANALNGVENQPDSAVLDLIIANSVAYEGIDLQVRTVAIHHFDLPWEPATLTQRNGRAWRQGNKNPTVDIVYYTAADSADGYRMQMLQGKGGWIAQLVKSTAFALANPAADDKATREQTFMSMCPDAEAASLVAERFRLQRERAEEAEARAGAQREFGRAAAFGRDVACAAFSEMSPERQRVLASQLANSLTQLESHVASNRFDYPDYVHALRQGRICNQLTIDKKLRPIAVGDALIVAATDVNEQQTMLVLRYVDNGYFRGFKVLTSKGRVLLASAYTYSGLANEQEGTLLSMKERLAPVRQEWTNRAKVQFLSTVAAQAANASFRYDIWMHGNNRTQNRYGHSSDAARKKFGDNVLNHGAWDTLSNLSNEQLAVAGWEDIIRPWLIRSAIEDYYICRGAYSDTINLDRFARVSAITDLLLRAALMTEQNDAGEKVAVTKAQFDAAFRAFDENARKEGFELPPRMARLASRDVWDKLAERGPSMKGAKAGFGDMAEVISELREWLRTPAWKRVSEWGAIPVVWKATGQVGLWYLPHKSDALEVTFGYERYPIFPGYVQVGSERVSIERLAENYIPFEPRTVEEAMAQIEVLQPNADGATIFLQTALDVQRAAIDPYFIRPMPRSKRPPSPFW
jgi:hypothetical protein